MNNIVGHIVAAVAAILISVTVSNAMAGKQEFSQGQFDTAMGSFIGTEEGMDKLFEAFQGHATKMQEKMRREAQQREAKDSEEYFNNPITVELSGMEAFKGKKDAPITIVEFSNFQCPFCKRGGEVMEEVVKAYPDKVRVVFKHLPLGFQKHSRPAALAAIAAQQQGKFWEMSKALFDNQSALSDELYLDLAKKLGLDVEKFKADMQSEQAKKQLAADEAAAQKLGVQGTPGFFVGGVPVRGAQPFANFKTIIDRLLEK